MRRSSTSSRHLRPLLFVASVALVLATGCSSESKEPNGGDYRAAAARCEKRHPARSVSPEELASWDIMGPGKATVIDSDSGKVVEFKGRSDSPDCIVLLSPSRLAENTRLRFRIRFLVPRSIVVMILSASKPGTGADITIPKEHVGWGFWGHRRKAHAQSYLFSIHTAFHQRDALLRKRPGKGNLDARPDTLTEEGRWYEVELGKMGNSIWLDRDGEPLLFGKDPNPLPGGRAGFLFTGDGDASVQIKDLSILECPS